MQDGETPRPKLDIVKLKEEAARRSEADKQAFGLWWNKLSQERQKEYLDLRVFSSDYDDKEFVLRKCRYILELMNSLKSADGRRIRPMGLAIHGELPVVFFQAGGHETEVGVSFNSMTHKPFEKNSEEKFFSDVDTGEYGIASEKTGPLGYRMDAVEVGKRIGWMK